MTGRAAVELGALLVSGTGAVALVAQGDIPAWISTVGFPVFVAAFLLLRMERELQRLGRGFERLSRAIERANGLGEPPEDDPEPANEK